MEHQPKKIVPILKHFQGMNKIDAFNIIHKLEVLLYYLPNPINMNNVNPNDIISEIENKKIDPFHFSILPNGKPCEFVGQNDWLHIYKAHSTSIFSRYLINNYYFKTKYNPLELKKLTKKNLLHNLKDKSEEIKVVEFLLKYKVTKKNLITDKFLILSI